MATKAELVEKVIRSNDLHQIRNNLRYQVHEYFKALHEQTKRLAGYDSTIIPLAPELEYLQKFINAYNEIRQEDECGTEFQFSFTEFDSFMKLAKRLDNNDSSVTIDEVNKAKGSLAKLLDQNELIESRMKISGIKFALTQEENYIKMLEKKYKENWE